MSLPSLMLKTPPIDPREARRSEPSPKTHQPQRIVRKRTASTRSSLIKQSLQSKHPRKRAPKPCPPLESVIKSKPPWQHRFWPVKFVQVLESESSHRLWTTLRSPKIQILCFGRPLPLSHKIGGTLNPSRIKRDHPQGQSPRCQGPTKILLQGKNHGKRAQAEGSPRAKPNKSPQPKNPNKSGRALIFIHHFSFFDRISSVSLLRQISTLRNECTWISIFIAKTTLLERDHLARIQEWAPDWLVTPENI